MADTSNQQFSHQAIKKAVLKKSAQSPLTLYPTAAAVLATASAGLFGIEGLLGAAAIATWSLTGAGWLWEYIVKRERHSMSYLSKLREKLEAQRLEKVASLTKELNAVEAESAVAQLSLFIRKFNNFREILSKKFETSELTYSRYLGIAEQVFLAGMDNLEKIYLSLKALSTVDHKRAEQRLSELGDSTNDNVIREKKAIEERLKMRSEQLALVESLISQNEAALTALDRVMAKLANVQTTKGHAELDMELAMEELGRMAKRADLYKRTI